MTLKSIRPYDWPERIHVHKAVVRFPNGIESGNWQTKPDDDTCEYVRALPSAIGNLTDLVQWLEADADNIYYLDPDAVAALRAALARIGGAA